MTLQNESEAWIEAVLLAQLLGERIRVNALIEVVPEDKIQPEEHEHEDVVRYALTNNDMVLDLLQPIRDPDEVADVRQWTQKHDQQLEHEELADVAVVDVEAFVLLANVALLFLLVDVARLGAVARFCILLQSKYLEPFIFVMLPRKQAQGTTHI